MSRHPSSKPAYLGWCVPHPGSWGPTPASWATPSPAQPPRTFWWCGPALSRCWWRWSSQWACPWRRRWSGRSGCRRWWTTSWTGLSTAPRTRPSCPAPDSASWRYTRLSRPPGTSRHLQDTKGNPTQAGLKWGTGTKRLIGTPIWPKLFITIRTADTVEAFFRHQTCFVLYRKGGMPTSHINVKTERQVPGPVKAPYML